MYRTVYVAALLGCVSWAHGQESHPEHAETVPQVFDARARALGELTTFGNQDGVLFSVGEASVVVPLQRKSSSGDGVRFSATQFQWSTDLFLDFTSSDCSGDPVVNNWKGPWPSVVFREGTTVTVYFPKDVPWSPMPLRSHLVSDTGQCESYNVPIWSVAWPLGAKLVITRGHPEPLTVQ